MSGFITDDWKPPVGRDEVLALSLSRLQCWGHSGLLPRPAPGTVFDLGGEPLGFRSGLWVPGSQGPVPVGPGLSVPCRRLALAPHPGTCREGQGLLRKERWEASENIEARLVAASGIGYIVAAESAAAKHLHALRTCFMHLDNSRVGHPLPRPGIHVFLR